MVRIGYVRVGFTLVMSTSCCLSPFLSSRVPNANAVPSGIWASELNIHSVIFQLYQDSLTCLLLPEDLNQSSCPIQHDLHCIDPPQHSFLCWVCIGFATGNANEV